MIGVSRLRTSAPPTVCAQPGCPVLVPAGTGGRCPQHARPAWQGTTGMGMSGGRWATIRRHIYKRDRGHCTLCGLPVPPSRYEVDHVVRRADGGGHDPANLRTVCLPCHTRRTRQGRVTPPPGAA